MRMDFNALKSYLINLREQERIVLSFSHIETLCGTISRSYIDNRDFDRRYATQITDLKGFTSVAG